MGDIVAWRVIDLPASGQISNVSKLVIRWRAGMPDHGLQPMLPDPFDKLVEYARLQVEREKLKLQRKALHKKKAAAAAAVDKPRRAYGPRDKDHRTYEGFRLAMLGYEKAVREVVGADGEVTHEAVYADAGGPTTRTQRRRMNRYGLRYVLDWPPSTWPVVPP